MTIENVSETSDGETDDPDQSRPGPETTGVIISAAAIQATSNNFIPSVAWAKIKAKSIKRRNGTKSVPIVSQSESQLPTLEETSSLHEKKRRKKFSVVSKTISNTIRKTKSLDPVSNNGPVDNAAMVKAREALIKSK
jgi:hypothetical protein